MDVLFGRDNDNVEVAKKPVTIAAPIKVAALGQLPPRRPVALTSDPETQELLPELGDDTLVAITPPIKPQAIQLASLTTKQEAEELVPSRFAVASINADEIPNPSRFSDDATSQASTLPPMRAGAQPNFDAAAALLAAYAPTPTSAPDAQKALEIILNRQNGATEFPQLVAAIDPKTQVPANIRDALAKASLQTDFSDFGSILNNVKTANTRSKPTPLSVEIEQRPGSFFNTEYDYDFSLLADPKQFNEGRFAVLFEPDTGDLTPSNVLGDQTQLGFATYKAQYVAPTTGFKTALSQ